MELKLIALSETDGEAGYRMLQEMPAQENGFINPMHGKSYGGIPRVAAKLHSRRGAGGAGQTAGRRRKAPIGSLTATGRSGTEKSAIS